MLRFVAVPCTRSNYKFHDRMSSATFLYTAFVLNRTELDYCYSREKVDDGQVDAPNIQLISCLDSSLGRAFACSAGGGGSRPARDMFVSAPT